ncbi:MAG: cytochrome c oxidase subunit 3 [Akkermansiaceae bacterium]
MEIPYVIEPRKDTGLNNSKIGIWLFLASEVMLFGGLFSGYIFLRIYADYPWPERTLPVLPGLINTFILIASSVTVVFAWVSLKLREWRKFQIYMAITIICAAIFMVFKFFEYNAKFHHQGISLTDYTVIEGHTHPQGAHGDDSHGDSHGDDKVAKKGPAKNYNIEVESVQIDLKKVDEIYFEGLSEQYNHGKFGLANDLTLSDGTVFNKGTALTWDLLEQAKADLKQALVVNSAINIEANRAAWKEVKEALPGKPYYDTAVKSLLAEKIAEHKGARQSDYLNATPSLTFEPASSHANLSVSPAWGKLANPKEGEETTLKLKDGTLVYGTAGDSSISLAVDGIDFRHTVMKAEEKGIDPVAAINNSWLLKNENIKAIWEKHKVITEKLAEELKEKDRSPNENDKYRINWQELVVIKDLDMEKLKAMELDDIYKLYPNDIEGITGPNHKKVHYPEVLVPREQVRFESVFSPRWNTYYALYFTITGLHGLHIIAGALVLGYYLFRGRKMYETKPEWLANRVEVGGLFWHFVDLVWIFLFPILYLM